MIRRQHLGQSAAAADSDSFHVDGLRIVRTLFEPGDWVKTRVPSRCSYAQWESLHVQVTGASHEVDGRRPDLGPGWMSRHDEFVMDPGDYHRVFDQQTEYWCCLWGDDRSSDDVDSIKVAAGEVIDLEPGSRLFVISGTFTAGGVTQVAPKLLSVTSSGKQLVAGNDVYAFIWTSR